MHIEQVSRLTDEIFDAVQRLVPLLGTHKPIPSWDDLTLLLDSENSRLLIARFPASDSPIAGMLTIALYRVPTGGRSIVEDLVVDDQFRGRGIAKALLQSAVEIAREAGANGVALTSNPQRVEANQLYLRMGFKKRQTNAYFYELK
ncbi:MAG: GNAT family N-acetyltransferase [Anaerolineales bacterium]|nr:GNAT family N-acetyltransferase [Anaerolineales bacterium]NTW12670.1 GNAT family N-acetyltransferase [Anaerolineales bacterium]